MATIVALIATEHRTLTRRRDFTLDRRSPLRTVQDILDILRAERSTGKLIINLNQGSVGVIQSEESAKL